MIEVFQAFAEMMQSKSRATLCYRPQVNGQLERSVKTVIQSVRVYAEDPLQQDWDEIVERLDFAINTSMDTTRKETHFYLVHGWNAHSTLRTMTPSLRRGTAKQSDALAWRRECNRQQEISLEMAKEYQATEKAKRARAHNVDKNVPRRLKQAQLTRQQDPKSKPKTQTTSRKKVEEYAYELELPDRSGYRFHPVQLSRLKPVHEFQSRPTTRLAPDISEQTRLDFDEELLPEDSCEPDQLAGEYEVETIFDDKTPLSTSTERPVHEFMVKWVGYDELTWELASNLSCGGLLYDYLRRKRSEQRFQMVQVADED
ncbi:unnamed protein product [Phytophthora fragariaefolia]|uniref:Unnamed protein product n=1 Tax=Phytophthora fragariaefolia TaxID=1490495 RepID=A0A9W6TRR3_9STRA|nr:unnamed protein product [Phytophthora fragariaefolia]